MSVDGRRQYFVFLSTMPVDEGRRYYSTCFNPFSLAISILFSSVTTALYVCIISTYIWVEYDVVFASVTSYFTCKACVFDNSRQIFRDFSKVFFVIHSYYTLDIAANYMLIVAKNSLIWQDTVHLKQEKRF